MLFFFAGVGLITCTCIGTLLAMKLAQECGRVHESILSLPKLVTAIEQHGQTVSQAVTEQTGAVSRAARAVEGTQTAVQEIGSTVRWMSAIGAVALLPDVRTTLNDAYHSVASYFTRPQHRCADPSHQHQEPFTVLREAVRMLLAIRGPLPPPLVAAPVPSAPQQLPTVPAVGPAAAAVEQPPTAVAPAEAKAPTHTAATCQSCFCRPSQPAAAAAAAPEAVVVGSHTVSTTTSSSSSSSYSAPSSSSTTDSACTLKKEGK